MRAIEEIKAELLQYKKYEDVPKELRKEYNVATFRIAQQEESEMCRRYEMTKDIPFDRSQEICNAERDGRCVVLPCNVGSVVYRVKRDGTIDTPYVTQFHISQKPWQTIVSFEGDMCGITDFGKTVFPTKEDAEQALKGGAE